MPSDDPGRDTPQDDYRPPCSEVAHMSPTANLDGLERRACPNCRGYFDADPDSEKTFCTKSCEERHEDGVYYR